MSYYCKKCGASVTGKYCSCCGTKVTSSFEEFRKEERRRRRNFTNSYNLEGFDMFPAQSILEMCWTCAENKNRIDLDIYNFESMEVLAYLALDKTEHDASRILKAVLPVLKLNCAL